MRLDQRVRETLRGLDRRLPWPVRRAARHAFRPGARDASWVTVVVAVSGGDVTWLDACLESVRGQLHRQLEVLVVPYADADPALVVARRHAGEDWRVRPVPRLCADRGTARNLGAARARGRYVCFVHPDDVLPFGGVAALVDSLDRSGSDLAVGRAVELPQPRGVEPTPDPAHETYRVATTMQEFPLAVADTGLGNRLFATGFWQRAGLAFPERGGPQPHDGQAGRQLVIEAFAASAAFDVLPDTTYHRMRRGGGLPFGFLSNPMEELEAWLEHQRVTLRMLEGMSAGAVRDAWAYVVCDAWVVPFLDGVERASERQWESLRTFLVSVVDLMSQDMWSRVRAECKVKVWLVAHDRRAALEELLAARWFELGNRPTRVVDGDVIAVLPFLGDSEPGVPDDAYLMSEEETRLQSVLRGARWVDETRLELDLFTWIDFVGTETSTPTVEVEAVDAASGRRVRLAVEQRVDPEVTVLSGHRYQDHAGGACTVQVDVRELTDDPAPRPPDPGRGEFVHRDSVGEWWLELRVVVRGVARRGSLARRDERGSAGLLQAPGLSARQLDDRRLQLVADPQGGVRLARLPATVDRITEATCHGRRVSGTITSVGPEPVTVVATRGDGVTGQARLEAAGPGQWRFVLEVPARPAQQGGNARVWRLRVVGRDRAERPVGFGRAGEDGFFLGEGDEADVVVGRTATCGSELVECARTVLIEDLTVDERGVTVTGSWPGRVPDRVRVRLRNKRLRQHAEALVTDGRRFTATVPLTIDEWGLGTTVFPQGGYFLDVVPSEDPDAQPAHHVLSRAVTDRLLVGIDRPELRAFWVSHGRETALRIAPPLAEDERGPYAQKQLQQWFGDLDAPLDPDAVYLQSYTGATATDSPRAIHEQLRRTRPDLTLYWGVADGSTSLPEGAVPVQLHSREWYRVLATSTYLCSNIDFDRWFRKRPGQQLLQTFHGYPAKSMGIRLWRAKQFTDRRIARELERTSGDWDLILTPAPEMDAHYRTQYAWDGPIESSGYPRDDVLVADDADAVRRRTRELLGIDAGQTAVLYAPTWRDDLATSYRSAPIVRHLDLETASEQLGEDFVLLMRGHRFHAKGARRSARTARLIDVTDYPEINDLILASDAAVLDYSSLRFDFALTGRPMLFLVPDLGDYVGGVRGFLFPFEESAPGPLIDDAEEVVARLRDLDGVRREFAEDYEAFNDRFNRLQDGRAAERVAKRFFTPGR